MKNCRLGKLGEILKKTISSVKFMAGLIGRVFGDNSLGAYPRFGITLGKRF